jgi:TolB protein
VPGDKIAFTAERDGDSEIYVMNAAGSGQTNLTNNSADDLDTSWGP